MGTTTIPHINRSMLTLEKQISDMEVVTAPQVTARKAGQMEEVSLQDTVVDRKQEVKILQVAQRYAS